MEFIISSEEQKQHLKTQYSQIIQNYITNGVPNSDLCDCNLSQWFIENDVLVLMNDQHLLLEEIFEKIISFLNKNIHDKNSFSLIEFSQEMKKKYFEYEILLLVNDYRIKSSVKSHFCIKNLELENKEIKERLCKSIKSIETLNNKIEEFKALKTRYDNSLLSISTSPDDIYFLKNSNKVETISLETISHELHIQSVFDFSLSQDYVTKIKDCTDICDKNNESKEDSLFLNSSNVDEEVDIFANIKQVRSHNKPQKTTRFLNKDYTTSNKDTEVNYNQSKPSEVSSRRTEYLISKNSKSVNLNAENISNYSNIYEISQEIKILNKNSINKEKRNEGMIKKNLEVSQQGNLCYINPSIKKTIELDTN